MNDFSRAFELPFYQLSRYPKQDCLNAKENGQWKSYSTQQVIDGMNDVSKALLTTGTGKGDVISLISNNRPEWNLVDLGGMQVGAVVVRSIPP
jgi:long-chain acyl-CoA synthetase